MYTLCPHCRTVFRVRAAHLRAAHGEVRCGRCGRTFDAVPALSDEYPENLSAAASPSPPERAAPAPEHHAQGGAVFSAIDPIATTRADDAIFRAPGPAAAARTRSRLRLALALGFPLALAFIAVLMYVQRDALAAYPQARPWLERMCEVAGCKLPLFKDRDKLRVIGRTVAAHPTLPEALEISLSFTNEAPYAQPYPTIQLRLLDINENVVSRHLFPPEVYLQNADVSAGLAPGERVQVVLEIPDPGPNAENFDFDFR